MFQDDLETRSILKVSQEERDWIDSGNEYYGRGRMNWNKENKKGNWILITKNIYSLSLCARTGIPHSGGRSCGHWQRNWIAVWFDPSSGHS